jgi:hypothetical protein
MKKLSESQLRIIIKEELYSVLNEAGYEPNFVEKGLYTVQDFFGVSNESGRKIKNRARELLDDEAFMKMYPSQESSLKKIIAMGNNEASSAASKYLTPVEEFYEKYLGTKASQEMETKRSEYDKHVRDQRFKQSQAARQAEQDRIAANEKYRREEADREEMERVYQTTAIENPNTGRLEYSTTRTPGALTRAEEAELARKARRKAYGI